MKNPAHLRVLFTAILVFLITAVALIFLSSTSHAASDIHGTVTDAETDDPIQGADVYIYDPNDKENNNHKTTTDRAGYYEVELDPGDYEIKIDKDGYETHTGEETVGFEEKVEHNAELQPDGGSGGGGSDTWVEGYVTEARDTRAPGDPIVGATVSISDRKNTFKGTTDNDGYYNISVKEEGDHSVKITHDDYEAHEGRLSVRTGGNTYDAQLSPKGSDDEGDPDRGTNDGSGDDDSDDGFDLVGMDGLMVAGWILAIGLLGIILLQRKGNETEEKEGGSGKTEVKREKKNVKPGERRTKAGKTGSGGTSTVVLDRKRSTDRPKNQCPKCGGKGEYNEEYNDHYCWQCREYFEDLK